MSRKRDLSPDEKALWERVARSARRLAPNDQAPVTKDDVAGASVNGTPVGSSAAKTTAAKATATPVGEAAYGGTADRTQPRTKTLPEPGSGLDRRTEQRLRRGQATVDGRIDLHGMTQRAAHSALRAFLHSAQQRGWRLVLVITGKGAPEGESSGKPGQAPRGVLRRQVPHWLSAPDLRPLVVGYREAHIRHGGGGALYVRLRRPSRND